jgi:methylmalonyl-CoA epimerase
MKATLDHIGIAVKNLDEALAFYRDALGLEIAETEEVLSQRVRAHFIPVGEANLELLEATAPESPIARYVDKRGPGIHHITLRVDDIHAAVARLKSRGVRLIDEQPRPGAEGSTIAFVHPSAAHGVLVELKQPAPAGTQHPAQGTQRAAPGTMPPAPGPAHEGTTRRFLFGDFDLISVCDAFFGLDGGAMFGVVPRPLWERKAAPDARNRISLAMRPLVVRGARTMLIDAGIGDKENAKFHDIYRVERERSLDQTLAEAGVSPDDIDIVLATHLHFDHAGGFTYRDASGRIRPRFPRAQYIVRRGEWDDAMNPHERNRASYLRDNYVPLAEAGVLQLVDDDQTIMPGVRVRRTGGHTMHHQIVLIESQGRTAAFVADLLPTTAHLPAAWMMGYDLYPMDTLASKKAFVREAIDRDMLVFFEHDPVISAARISERDGKPVVEPVNSV